MSDTDIQQKYRVIIDTNEVAKKSVKKVRLPDLLVDKLNDLKIEWTAITLPYGDYIFPDLGKVIERKTFKDFLNTWQHGRGSQARADEDETDNKGKEGLWEQITGCLQSYSTKAEIYLLIEDGLRVIPDQVNKCLWYIPETTSIEVKQSQSGYEYGQIYYLQRFNTNPNSWLGILDAIRGLGVNVILTSSPNQALEIIVKWLTDKKPKKPGIFPLRKDKIKMSTKQSQRFVLEGFDGIGPSFADELLKTHRTLIDIFNKVVNAQDVKSLGVPRLPQKVVDQMKFLLTADYTQDSVQSENKNIDESELSSLS